MEVRTRPEVVRALRGLPVRIEEPLDFGAVGHGVLRAAPRDGERAGRGGEADGALERPALGEGDRERAGEPVARGDGVDRLDREGGDVALAGIRAASYAEPTPATATPVSASASDWFGAITSSAAQAEPGSSEGGAGSKRTGTA